MMWLNGKSAVQFSHNLGSNRTPFSSALTADAYNGHLPLFKFKNRCEILDWRRISAIDVERVANELDFIILQENIMNITFCNMDAEKCPYCQNSLDPALLKAFKLAQFTIEYLIHSQDYLTHNLQMCEEKLQESEFKKDQIKQEFCKLADEVKSQKKESKHKKQLISTQQMMLHSGANNYYKCQYCDKTFINYFFMRSHILRRHPDQIDVDQQKKKQSDKMQAEIDQLKKQLQDTQSQLEIAKLSQEHETRMMKEEKIQSLERWKEEEKVKLNKEMEKMKEMFVEVFKEITEKNAALETFQSEIESLMSSITKNQKASTCYYKKKIRKLGQSLQDQHQLKAHTEEQLEACPVKTPKKIIESQSIKHLREVSICNEDLRKVLQKNPTISEELHKIVEQSLAEKLQYLGIKPDVQGISEGQFTRVLDAIESDRKEKSKVFPNFCLFRESLLRKVEDKIKGKESLCYLKSTVKKSTNTKLSQIVNNTQPSCSKICKTVKVPSPNLSSSTLSTSSAGSELVGSLSSSTESSENVLSDTCELEEVCTFSEEKPSEVHATGGLTETMEKELSQRVKARAAKLQSLHKKNVAGEQKHIVLKPSEYITNPLQLCLWSEKSFSCTQVLHGRSANDRSQLHLSSFPVTPTVELERTPGHQSAINLQLLDE
ncbi:cilium assembly protein DZIP1-like isoform X4 [Hypanus sabinus]|uniref:cilium assembly protein DZIP1-like isoform X4 n=1 Tax=Hypanus sabinus TaxID=79690 RepID=UPI0028C489AB|nr:cilium assembly protein DZIP1-like isoform X4 [Hypanus sabinus]